jgi:hypothetical protein
MPRVSTRKVTISTDVSLLRKGIAALGYLQPL